MILKILKYIVLAIILFVVLWLGSSTIAGIVGAVQNNKVAEVEVTNPTITYIGDSLTNGFQSSGGLDPNNLGYRDNVDDALGATSYNYAVGGYTSKDVLVQLEEDTTINQVNKVIRGFKGDLDEVYGDVDNDLSISESIAQSDYVIATIGANDLITELLNFNQDGSFSVEFDGIKDKLEAIRARKLDIYNQIYEINPDVQIIDVGIYFAYPHIGDLFTRSLYPVLMYAEHYMFIEDDNTNTHKVTIRDNMQANIKQYIDNPVDIHPNESGYEIMANEILKEISKLQ